VHEILGIEVDDRVDWEEGHDDDDDDGDDIDDDEDVDDEIVVVVVVVVKSSTGSTAIHTGRVTFNLLNPKRTTSNSCENGSAQRRSLFTREGARRAITAIGTVRTL